jgi:hypothetical protein
MDNEQKRNYDTIIEFCIPQFRSGNGIPVTRNTVSREDLYKLLDYVLEIWIDD